MDENFYMCFSTGFPKDMAVKLFVKKHGVKPDRMFVDKGLLKLGPEPTRSNKLHEKQKLVADTFDRHIKELHGADFEVCRDDTCRDAYKIENEVL
jgi:hypothetical protein